MNIQPNTAFLFPGQGSQSVGMLGDLAQSYAIISQTYAQASEVLGYDLWHLVQSGPEALLNQTERTQPALLAAGVALFKVWQSKNPDQMPAFMAGHSLGEYTALVCAGVLDYRQAIALVALRGTLMQQAVPEGVGAMAAIVGLTDEQVQTLCDQAAQDDVVSPANFNAIGQVVVAGHVAAVMRVIELAKQAGAKLAKQIPVSVPSHCALMKSASDQLGAALKKTAFTSPQVPVIHNVDACAHQKPEEIRTILARQLYQPVRWVQTIQWLYNNGVTQSIECGPGKVLAGLNKRIASQLKTDFIE